LLGDDNSFGYVLILLKKEKMFLEGKNTKKEKKGQKKGFLKEI
jgi:hypothetical protein